MSNIFGSSRKLNKTTKGINGKTIKMGEIILRCNDFIQKKLVRKFKKRKSNKKENQN